MIWFFRALFLIVVGSMLAVTVWASWRCPLFAVPPEVARHPWFIATLCDAYWGFLTFFAWVCYKQTSAFARGAWLVAILALGNIAMASFVLAELFRLPRDGDISRLLLERRAGVGRLGPALALVGAAVILLAWRQR